MSMSNSPKILLCALLLATQICAHAQNRYMLTAGFENSPVQAYQNALTEQYIFAPECGSVYTHNTFNASINLSLGAFLTAHKRGWELRGNLSFYEENIKFASGSISDEDIDFHHRAYHLMAGVRLGVPLSERSRIKIKLMPGLSYKVARMNQNLNLVDRLLVEGLPKLFGADPYSTKIDMQKYYVLPRMCYNMGVLFGNNSAAVILNVLYQSSSLDLPHSAKPYLIKHSVQYSITLSKTMWYSYK